MMLNDVRYLLHNWHYCKNFGGGSLWVINSKVLVSCVIVLPFVVDTRQRCFYTWRFPGSVAIKTKRGEKVWSGFFFRFFFFSCSHEKCLSFRGLSTQYFVSILSKLVCLIMDIHIWMCVCMHVWIAVVCLFIHYALLGMHVCMANEHFVDLIK